MKPRRPVPKQYEPKKYEASIAAARKAGGDAGQSNWWSRLMAVMKKRAQSEKQAEKKSKAER